MVEYPDGRQDRSDNAKPKKERGIGFKIFRFIAKTLGVLVALVASLAIMVYGAVTVVCQGPFPTAKELLVVTAMETSAAKFLARIHLTEEEIDHILNSNAVLAPEEVTDTTVEFKQQENVTAEDYLDIEIHDVVRATFVGKMMIVKDPSRVRLATIDTFGYNVIGKKVEDFVIVNDAVGGINAGGFADYGGVGTGGMPDVLLIKDGIIKVGSASTYCNVIGLSFDNRLIVGEMTAQAAIDMGVRDAVHFSPTLIVNGKAAEVSGSGGGINPRTCIGQREDGAILFLVIDGRQVHSIGASLQDCVQVMLDFDAINAANLDGGSSSMMIYEGEVLNSCSSLYGSRTQPAAFIVDRLPEEAQV